jgi:hypothetical protein
MYAMDALERFLEKISPEPNTGCWLWTAGLFHDGYGKFWFENAHQQAHRVSWKLLVGEIPLGLHILHHCDVRWCVSPYHLFCGTRMDNMTDKLRKARHGGKLNPQLVRQIRNSWPKVSMGRLAQEFNTDRGNISEIVNRKAWTCVP